MPSIRLPKSAEPLLPLCRRFEAADENACFESYAELLNFLACCGYSRVNGRTPAPSSEFLSSIHPIDIAIFKNQQLYPTLLLIVLGSSGDAASAGDEDGLCRVVEAFAEIGAKHLTYKLFQDSAGFPLQLARLIIDLGSGGEVGVI